ncbi:methionine ABC transporter ATP-binding protein [Paracoccus benzoatiresistens]|uniref:methionine ABC transporter ATP-binding protein n=1 Tax=Paracoccus benzoatiresistens TaxID=2997341 RepID=UPI002E32BC7E|nr:ATP-binding cassette domain-containing protein [Paracoccus sp. EF6]
MRENVALPLKVAGVAREQIDTRVSEVLDLAWLSDKGAAYPSRLSGGQKQRVSIARALVSRPEILLCDKATSAFDPETTLSILTLLRDINARLGLTIVLITHEMAVIREICDRVLVLEGGRIAEAGPVWQVFGPPRHPATRALLAPLMKNLPDDLAARLRPARHSHRDEIILELGFAGTTRPDLGALAQGIGGGGRLLTADIDSIQGRQVGRVLIAAPSDADLTPLDSFCDHRKVLGHADHAND